MDILLIAVIINTILCVLGIVPSFMIQMGTVMGGASVGASELGSWIAIAGMIFPAMPIISIVGSWIAYLLGISWLAIVFVALPWVYLLGMVVSIALLFSGKKES